MTKIPPKHGPQRPPPNYRIQFRKNPYYWQRLGHMDILNYGVHSQSWCLGPVLLYRSWVEYPSIP